MTKRIISVSRRTDIPAFHGEQFMKNVNAGSIESLHPITGQKTLALLKKDDVACFVFWSKDYTPFLANLHELKDMGYRSYFNYTLTRLPPVFETKVNHETALRSLRVISRMYSPAHINWRYDPILFSDRTGYDWHIKNFTALCSDLKGYVNRCYFNFPVLYGKVQTNLKAFTRKTGIKVYNPEQQIKSRLIEEFFDIAQAKSITLFSCAESHGLDPRVQRAHCIDADMINQLYNLNQLPDYRPSREGCGCSQSIDIGAYNTCNHGCVYCYANTSAFTIKQALL
ncbi:MAG: DUF1848 family protein [Candidatus Methanoperedens sp.]|nr:DUF1848 family protein [Candidatus Methanoperedens sp.]